MLTRRLFHIMHDDLVEHRQVGDADRPVSNLTVLQFFRD